MIRCVSCNAAYPEEGVPYICPVCGGLFDIDPIRYKPRYQTGERLPGIWNYHDTFDFLDGAPIISLGEGHTPLIWTEAFGKQIALKCEYENPTGSFKDRGSATLVSFLVTRGVRIAIDDSSGNAGASFAAYAARAGIKAKIYVPEAISNPKQKQIEAYGADVVSVAGGRSKTAEMARNATDSGCVYASHAYLPINLFGYATIAYEIVEQLGDAPGTFICPVGQGGLMLGAARGFAALHNAGIIHQIPILVGVQALACAPIYNLCHNGSSSLESMVESETLAEGVRVLSPLRAQTVVQTVLSSGGTFVAVPEADILPGRDELSCRGFYTEITSAIVWSALSQLNTIYGEARLREPIVMVLTGSGLKSS